MLITTNTWFKNLITDDSVIYHTTSNQNHIKLILKKTKDFGYEVKPFQ